LSSLFKSLMPFFKYMRSPAP